MEKSCLICCLDCKHSGHFYNPPSMGEGEPELEFYCNHPGVPEFEIEEESELFEIAEKCSYFEHSSPSLILEDEKYPIELLDLVTELVQKIKVELFEEECSFDEAIEVAAIAFRKVSDGEIELKSLKSLLPSFLETVRK